MTAPSRRFATSLGIGILLLPASLVAQAEFATPVPRGAVRINITPDWLSYDHRFGLNVPGYANGSPVPIGLPFSAESLGAQTFPFLQQLQSSMRAASGLGTFSLSLGRAVTQLNASVRTIPLGIELGLSDRLAIGVTVPIVHSRVDANFVVDTTTGKRSNVAFADPVANAPFRSQVDAAMAALTTLAASGPPSLRPPAQAALAQLKPFQDLAHAALLPLSASAAGAGVTAQLAGVETAYQLLLNQAAGSGVSLPAVSALLTLPDSALTRADLERFFTDSTLPLAADTMGNAIRTGVGDITAHATWQFANGRRYRGQLLLSTQFPTGGVPFSRSFLDLGTGTHQMAFGAGLASDLLLGDHFLIHAVARAGAAKADQVVRRVTSPDSPFPTLAQLATLNRKPAGWAGLDVQPTWLLDDAFSVRVTYSWFTQGQTHYRYVTPSDSARIGLPASVLDQQTDARLMRFGGGVTFSTLGRYATGAASLPYSVTVTYENTVWGRGGQVPQASIFRIQFRAYIQLFK
jgi:hypothetical protein